MSFVSLKQTFNTFNLFHLFCKFSAGFYHHLFTGQACVQLTAYSEVGVAAIASQDRIPRVYTKHPFELDTPEKGLHEKLSAMARDNHSSQEVPSPLHQKTLWHSIHHTRSTNVYISTLDM